MNAPAKIRDNLHIWRAVEKTDPSHTKRVNQRGGFTAISAHYQVMRATEMFGPVGIGWGYSNGEPIWHETLVIVPVTLWHGERDNTFGPVFGGAEWRNNKGFVDSDAPKKAATDGLTKALSQLGFNADVFMGRFDDNKYIQQMEREFAANDAANDAAGGQSQGNGQGAVSPRRPAAHSALKTKLRGFVHELNGCGDGDELSAFLATPDAIKIISETQDKLPHLWSGLDWPEGIERPEEFVPLAEIIAKRERECAAVTAQYLNA